jgi:glutamate mutase epsilon subunit
MGVINQIINVGDLTLAEQRDYRVKAIQAGYRRAIAKKIGDAQDIALVLSGNQPKANSIDVREFQPVLDAATALDQWNTAALAVVGTAYSVFQAVAAPVMAANKLAVFYRVAIETVPVPISRVIIRSGGATGNILGVFDMEQLTVRDEIQGYFSEPVVIDPSITYAVQVVCRIATGVLARVIMGAYIFEPSGQTIATQ